MQSVFKEYHSKPIIRQAFQITPEMTRRNIGSGVWEIFVPMHPQEVAVRIEFTASVIPIVGDWILNNGDDDVYHCTDKVFRDRNIVLDQSITAKLIRGEFTVD